MKPEERKKKLKELENELIGDRSLIRSGGALENPGKVRELRRAIARLKTVIAEERGEK
jgi:large subunit ribosomal protein L29